MAMAIRLTLLTITLSIIEIIDSYVANNISASNITFTEPKWGWGGAENLVNWPE